MKCYLSRREGFSSSHKLHHPEWNDAKNNEVYNKCNNIHGHNYVVEVILFGDVDSDSGMVYNITDLKQIIKEKILDVMDHRDIDSCHPFFQNRRSTAENIAIFCWLQLKDTLGQLLHEIRLHETEKNVVYYRGD